MPPVPLASPLSRPTLFEYLPQVPGDRIGFTVIHLPQLFAART